MFKPLHLLIFSRLSISIRNNIHFIFPSSITSTPFPNLKRLVDVRFLFQIILVTVLQLLIFINPSNRNMLLILSVARLVVYLLPLTQGQQVSCKRLLGYCRSLCFLFFNINSWLHIFLNIYPSSGCSQHLFQVSKMAVLLVLVTMIFRHSVFFVISTRKLALSLYTEDPTMFHFGPLT